MPTPHFCIREPIKPPEFTAPFREHELDLVNLHTKFLARIQNFRKTQEMQIYMYFYVSVVEATSENSRSLIGKIRLWRIGTQRGDKHKVGNISVPVPAHRPEK